jgi:hypothetical protein
MCPVLLAVRFATFGKKLSRPPPLARCLNCQCRRSAARSRADSGSSREPSIDVGLPIAKEAGRYFDCRRAVTPSLDSLQGLEAESALLAKLPPSNERVPIDGPVYICTISHSSAGPPLACVADARTGVLCGVTTELYRASSFQLGARLLRIESKTICARSKTTRDTSVLLWNLWTNERRSPIH